MSRVCVLIFISWCVNCYCGAPHEQALPHALRSLGQPIASCPRVRPADIVLNKSLPAQLAFHKVVRREFSEDLINNLLKVTELRRDQTFQGANRGVFGTPGVRYYGSLENNHTLTIIPAQGWIHYTRMEAVDDKGDRTLVAPSEEQTLQRALEFARMLGLKEADLARHPVKDRLHYHFCKTEGGPVLQVPRVKSMEVFFRRAIDGHPVVAQGLYGGLWVGFGFRGMLYKFALTARATEPLSTIRVAPLADQLKQFAEGRQAYAFSWPVDPQELKKDQDAVLELSLVEVVYFEDAPEVVQKIIPPLLRWEGELVCRGERHFVVLFTPIKETKRN